MVGSKNNDTPSDTHRLTKALPEDSIRGLVQLDIVSRPVHNVEAAACQRPPNGHDPEVRSVNWLTGSIYAVDLTYDVNDTHRGP